MTNKYDLTNTLKWLGDYKPALPTEPDSFIVQNAIQIERLN